MLQELVKPPADDVVKVTDGQTPAIGNHTKWAQSMKDFAENLEDIRGYTDPTDPTDPNYHMSHEAKKLKDIDGKKGLSNATYTQNAENEKRNKAALETQKISAARAMASTVEESLRISANSKLLGMTFDSHEVSIREDGVLMIQDEEGNPPREATLEEKNLLEDQSQQNTGAFTVQEKQMHDFLHGRSEVVPDHLKALAEPNYDTTNMTREQYMQVVLDEYADRPNIISRMIDPTEMAAEGLGALDGQSLLPPSEDMFVSEKLNKMFNSQADMTSSNTPATPNYVSATPQLPTPQALTPA